MDRLISEQAVIDAVSEWLYDKTRKESIETVINAIPSAEPREVLYTGDGYADGEIVYKIDTPKGKGHFIEAQAGEYIPKQEVLNTIDKWYEDKADIEDLIVKITYMPSVAIPTAYKGMTNGEVIKTIFDVDEIQTTENTVIVRVKGSFCAKMQFLLDWWNSPYEPQERSDKEWQ